MFATEIKRKNSKEVFWDIFKEFTLWKISLGLQPECAEMFLLFMKMKFKSQISTLYLLFYPFCNWINQLG